MVSADTQGLSLFPRSVTAGGDALGRLHVGDIFRAEVRSLASDGDASAGVFFHNRRLPVALPSQYRAGDVLILRARSLDAGAEAFEILGAQPKASVGTANPLLEQVRQEIAAAASKIDELRAALAVRPGGSEPVGEALSGESSKVMQGLLADFLPLNELQIQDPEQIAGILSGVVLEQQQLLPETPAGAVERPSQVRDVNALSEVAPQIRQAADELLTLLGSSDPETPAQTLQSLSAVLEALSPPAAAQKSDASQLRQVLRDQAEQLRGREPPLQELLGSAVPRPLSVLPGMLANIQRPLVRSRQFHVELLEQVQDFSLQLENALQAGASTKQLAELFKIGAAALERFLTVSADERLPAGLQRQLAALHALLSEELPEGILPSRLPALAVSGATDKTDQRNSPLTRLLSAVDRFERELGGSRNRAEEKLLALVRDIRSDFEQSSAGGHAPGVLKQQIADALQELEREFPSSASGATSDGAPGTGLSGRLAVFRAQLEAARQLHPEESSSVASGRHLAEITTVLKSLEASLAETVELEKSALDLLRDMSRVLVDPAGSDLHSLLSQNLDQLRRILSQGESSNVFGDRVLPKDFLLALQSLELHMVSAFELEQSFPHPPLSAALHLFSSRNAVAQAAKQETQTALGLSHSSGQQREDSAKIAARDRNAAPSNISSPERGEAPAAAPQLIAEEAPPFPRRSEILREKFLPLEKQIAQALERNRLNGRHSASLLPEAEEGAELLTESSETSRSVDEPLFELSDPLLDLLRKLDVELENKNSVIERKLAAVVKDILNSKQEVPRPAADGAEMLPPDSALAELRELLAVAAGRPESRSYAAAFHELQQIIRGQDTLKQLNPLFRAMGEPTFVLFPHIIQGMISRVQLLYLPAENSVGANERCGEEQSEEETDRIDPDEEGGHPNKQRSAPQRVRFQLTLPALGNLQVDFSHTLNELLLTVTAERAEAVAFLQESLPELDHILRAIGYSTVALKTAVSPTGVLEPEWLSLLSAAPDRQA
jgi:hypothetical protein